jgi:CubicO group peptidase (beta-lactamase class C family)
MVALAEELQALADEAPMPGVAISLFGRDQVIAEVTHGTADLDSGRPVKRADWWDLASLTKTLVTLPEVLDLVALGRIGLGDPLGAVWPAAGGSPVAAATIAQLLSYDAGMPASVKFYTGLRGREPIIEAALAVRPERPAGSGAVYSDVNFIVLGAMVEALTGSSLAPLARKRSGLRYPPLPGDAVATERCDWRGRLVVGEVHDENASAMGGVAGHAGAFGTVEVVTRAAQAWLAERQFSPALHRAVRTCWSKNAGGDRYGLGWFLSPTMGLGGPRASESGYGMSGFVGNRIWLEPDYGYGVVVLSNRIHPVRSDRAAFNAWCARMLDSVAGAVRRSASSAVTADRQASSARHGRDAAAGSASMEG